MGLSNPGIQIRALRDNRYQEFSVLSFSSQNKDFFIQYYKDYKKIIVYDISFSAFFIIKNLEINTIENIFAGKIILTRNFVMDHGEFCDFFNAENFLYHEMMKKVSEIFVTLSLDQNL